MRINPSGTQMVALSHFVIPPRLKIALISKDFESDLRLGVGCEWCTDDKNFRSTDFREEQNGSIT